MLIISSHVHFTRPPSLISGTKGYTQFSLIGQIRIYFWDQTKSKSIDQYLWRIGAFFDISVNEQLTPERHSFCHPVFFFLEIRVAPTINWSLSHVQLLVSRQLFSQKMDENRYLYELLVKRQSESTKFCWLHRSLNFFIRPFFNTKGFDGSSKIRYTTVLGHIYSNKKVVQK